MRVTTTGSTGRAHHSSPQCAGVCALGAQSCRRLRNTRNELLCLAWDFDVRFERACPAGGIEDGRTARPWSGSTRHTALILRRPGEVHDLSIAKVHADLKGALPG